MNLTLSFWSSLAGLLAVEAALVVAVAWLAARWLRSPQLQRAVWQAALLGVALLWVAELAGVRGQLAKLRPNEPPARMLTVRLLDAPRGEPVAEPFPDEQVEAALPVVTPPPVWWPGWLWLAGLVLLTGRLALARAGLAWCAFKTRGGLESPPSRERGLSSPLTDPTAPKSADTDAIIEPLRRRLGLRRVRVLVWPRLRGPVAFGMLCPTVALPEDFTARFSPAQREAMLAHELAHLAARDPLWLALADLVCALAWWHPAVWWARRQLRAACESAADEAAALVPDGRAALAESLVTFGRELASPRWARGIGVAGDGLKSLLARRVKLLLHASGEWRAVRPARLWATRLGAAGVVAALVIAPWPGADGAGLTPLLAAVKAGNALPSPHMVEGAVSAKSDMPTFGDIVFPKPWEVTNAFVRQSGVGYEIPAPLSQMVTTRGHSMTNPNDPRAGEIIQRVNFYPNSPPEDVTATTKSVSVAFRDPQIEPAATHHAPNGSALFTRRYKVDPTTFLAGLAAVLALDPSAPAATNTLAQAQQDLSRLFWAAGVAFPEPTTQPTAAEQDRRAFFFNDRTGVLFVRATATDLDVIDRAVEALTPPPTTQVVDPAKPATTTTDERRGTETVPISQIELEVHFAEITERGSDDLGLDWLFGQSPTNNPALQSGPATNLLTEPGSPRGQNLRVDLLRTEGQSATLTAAQFVALRKRLESRGGVEFLAAPKLITEPGRQARISVGDVRTIVSGVDAAQGSATHQAGLRYQTEQIATGPSVDLVPTLEGAATRLTIVAKVTEFLGYDQPKAGQEVMATSPGGEPVKGMMPLPRLRVRSTQAEASALAGETVVLRGPLVDDTLRTKDKVPVLGDLPVLGRLFRSESKSTVRKRLYVFVTPARVSATGEKQ